MEKQEIAGAELRALTATQVAALSHNGKPKKSRSVAVESAERLM